MYNPPRPPEVYTLPDAVNDTVPEEVRRQFRCDSAGRVLFFTAPPLDRTHKPLSPGSAGLGHSAKYLSGRKEWLAERERKRKIRDEESSRHVRRKSPSREILASEPNDSMVSRATEALEKWFRNLDESTAQWQKQAGLEGWKGGS
jgi:chromatin structure-remodeling complex subunit RSC1/2